MFLQLHRGETSAFVLRRLIRRVLLCLLCVGFVACGGDSSQSRSGGGGAPATANSREAVGPQSGDTTSAESVGPASGEATDTLAEGESTGEDAGQENEGPTPIEGDVEGFEEVDADEVEDDSEPKEQDDPSGGVGGGSNPPSDPDPTPQDSRRLVFTTEPGQASVTIVNEETGTQKTSETPATFEVPPGLYSWTAEKQGYASKTSQGAIDLETRQEATREIRLTEVSGEGAFLRRANEAYENRNYQEALSLYRQVPEPGPNQDPTKYLQAQTRLGQIYWKQQENYNAAIEAFQNVVDYDDTRYEAFLNLALVQYELENYAQTLDRLGRVNELTYRIPSEDQRRLRIGLRIKYRRALSLYQLAQEEDSQDRRARALRARQTFQSFLSTIPTDLESAFSQQIDDAEQKQDALRTLLQEIR